MNDDGFKLLTEIAKESVSASSIAETCSHESTILDGVQKVCMDCGEVISKNFSYEKEWRYYGAADSKHTNDPNRCNIRRQDEKGIQKDLEKFQINTKVIVTATEIYEKVTNNKIFRGNTRKGIIFACVFHAYNINKLPQSCKSLIQVFDLEQKVALKGLKFVNLNLPLSSDVRKSNYSNNIVQLIHEIMSQFNATEMQIQEVLRLYEHIHDKSSLLNRSRPQSVACGLIRYYIMKKNPDYSIDYFREKIKLSDLTLSRIVKEIDTIFS